MAVHVMINFDLAEWMKDVGPNEDPLVKLLILNEKLDYIQEKYLGDQIVKYYIKFPDDQDWRKLYMAKIENMYPEKPEQFIARVRTSYIDCYRAITAREINEEYYIKK